MFLTLLCAAAPAAAASGADPARERELTTLRESLQALRERKRADAAARDRELAALRELELQLTDLAAALASLREQVAAADERVATLSAALREREAELAGEREALARQLRALYQAGPAAPLRLVLMQEDPARLSRLLTWQQYLARHRADAIAALRERLAALLDLRRERDVEAAALQRLLDAQTARRAELEAARAQRRALLAALESGLLEADAEIARVERRERELVELLDDLARLFSDSPAAELEVPFASRRGKLDWPVAHGSLRADYGERRVGRDLRWNGLMIGAERGEQVRAVAYGRIAYADWLPGLGLLTIVEHGDGYLSLYGHNDTLLRDVGDWVAPGEAIATVGDSGGLADPTLYFEIRRGRRQENPQRWFARPLGR